MSQPNFQTKRQQRLRLYGIGTLTRIQATSFMRDRQSLFWTMAFPLMFLLLFGAIFASNDATARATLAQVGPVAIIDQLPATAREQLNNQVELKSTDLATARDQVRSGTIDGAVLMSGSQLVVLTSPADPVRAAKALGLAQALVDQANLAASGKPATYSLVNTSVAGAGLTPIQTLAPGLIGWAIAMGATFGAAMVLVTWRNIQLLRRLRLTPVSTGAIVGSRALITLGIALTQLIIMLGMGRVLFGLQLTGSWWMSIPLALCGALAFMSIGLLVGSFAKTPEAASGLANLIVLPMAFLSGSFIRLDTAPAWMQTLSQMLPLGYLNQGFTDVMVRGQGPSSALVPMFMLLAFTVVVSLLAMKIFRWED